MSGSVIGDESDEGPPARLRLPGYSPSRGYLSAQRSGSHWTLSCAGLLFPSRCAGTRPERELPRAPRRFGSKPKTCCNRAAAVIPALRLALTTASIRLEPRPSGVAYTAASLTSG